MSYKEWEEVQREIYHAPNLSVEKIAKRGIVDYTEATFRTEALRRRHYDKHKAEFGGIDIDAYEKQARALLLDQAEEIRELVRSDLSLSRYKPSTNEFVVGTAEGYIRTYFRPNELEAYWEEELKRNE